MEGVLVKDTLRSGIRGSPNEWNVHSLLRLAAAAVAICQSPHKKGVAFPGCRGAGLFGAFDVRMIIFSLDGGKPERLESSIIFTSFFL